MMFKKILGRRLKQKQYSFLYMFGYGLDIFFMSIKKYIERQVYPNKEIFGNMERLRKDNIEMIKFLKLNNDKFGIFLFENNRINLLVKWNWYRNRVFHNDIYESKILNYLNFFRELVNQLDEIIIFFIKGGIFNENNILFLNDLMRAAKKYDKSSHLISDDLLCPLEQIKYNELSTRLSIQRKVNELNISNDIIKNNNIDVEKLKSLKIHNNLTLLKLLNDYKGFFYHYFDLLEFYKEKKFYQACEAAIDMMKCYKVVSITIFDYDKIFQNEKKFIDCKNTFSHIEEVKACITEPEFESVYNQLDQVLPYKDFVRRMWKNLKKIWDVIFNNVLLKQFSQINTVINVSDVSAELIAKQHPKLFNMWTRFIDKSSSLADKLQFIKFIHVEKNAMSYKDFYPKLIYFEYHNENNFNMTIKNIFLNCIKKVVSAGSYQNFMKFKKNYCIDEFMLWYPFINTYEFQAMLGELKKKEELLLLEWNNNNQKHNSN